MRRLAWLLLSLLLLAGCGSESKRPTPFPPPLDWYLEHGENSWSEEACPYPVPAGNPTLAGVQVFGLDVQSWWHPGYFNKFNLVPAQSVKTIVLSVRPVGQESPLFRSLVAEGPQYLHLPGPGCWEFTLEADGRHESVILPVRPDSPAYLNVVQPGYRATTSLTETNQRFSELLKIAATGKEIAEPKDGSRPALLELRWTKWGGSALYYYPKAQGRPAVLGVPNSLLTGDCAANGFTFRALPASLSERLDRDLVGIEHERGLIPSANNCTTFTLSRP